MSLITQIKLKFSNAYLVQGTRPILVDTGSPGEARTIQKALAAQGVKLTDLSLILHTHVHGDHVGSTTELLEMATFPTAYHHADEPLMQRGTNGILNGIGMRGKIMARFMNHAAFRQFTPTVALTDGMRLESYGIAGTVIHTPGHTPGSVSILLDTGEALIGDLLMGGYIGGNIMPRRPEYHYFAERFDLVQQSLKRILSFDPHTLYVGHGGPLSADAVRSRWPEFAHVAVGA